MITSLGTLMNLDGDFKHSLYRDPFPLTHIEHNHQVFLRTHVARPAPVSTPSPRLNTLPIPLTLSSHEPLGYSMVHEPPRTFKWSPSLHSHGSHLTPSGRVEGEGVRMDTNNGNTFQPYSTVSPVMDIRHSPHPSQGHSNSAMGYVSSVRRTSAGHTRGESPGSLSPVSEVDSSDICRYWGLGTCRYNEACRFKHIGAAGRTRNTKKQVGSKSVRQGSHGSPGSLSNQDAQLHSMPALTSARLDLSSSTPDPVTDKNRLEIGVGVATCRYWLQGICNRGSACRFVHAVTPHTHEYLKGDTKEEQALLNHVLRLQKLAGMTTPTTEPQEPVGNASLSGMVNISTLMNKVTLEETQSGWSVNSSRSTHRTSPVMHALSDTPVAVASHMHPSHSKVPTARAAESSSSSFLHRSLERSSFNLDQSYSPWSRSAVTLDDAWGSLLL